MKGIKFLLKLMIKSFLFYGFLYVSILSYFYNLDTDLKK